MNTPFVANSKSCEAKGQKGIIELDFPLKPVRHSDDNFTSFLFLQRTSVSQAVCQYLSHDRCLDFLLQTNECVRACVCNSCPMLLWSRII